MRLPVFFIIVLFILPILIDLYISADCKQIWGKKGRLIYWVTSILCYAILIVAISLPRRSVDSDLTPVMWLLYIYLSIYVGKIFYLLFSVFGRSLKKVFKWKNGWYPFRWMGLFIGLFFIGMMFVGTGYTRHHIVVEDVDVYSNNLPPSFENYQIAQISDLHVGTWGKDTEFIQNLVKKINGLNPDLIVFTGDIVNRETGEIYPFIDALARLKAKDGVYSILGNHDYGDYMNWPDSIAREENNKLLASIERGMGWNLLNNKKVFLKQGNDSIILIGVENWGEPPFPKYGNLEIALSSNPDSLYNQNDGNFKILLSHNPEHWNQEVSKNTNIDLTLSGHTHAMQGMIKIGDWKWSPSKFRYENWGGLYGSKNKNGEPTQLYVNIGAGSVGMPSRLLAAYPEITLFKLKKGEPRY